MINLDFVLDTKVPSAHKKPAKVLEPPPCAAAAPTLTSTAANNSRPFGKRRCVSGPAKHSTSGTQPTTTPTAAGSDSRNAASKQMLNPTSPVAASSTMRPASRMPSCGQGARRSSMTEASAAAPIA